MQKPVPTFSHHTLEAHTQIGRFQADFKPGKAVWVESEGAILRAPGLDLGLEVRNNAPLVALLWLAATSQPGVEMRQPRRALGEGLHALGLVLDRAGAAGEILPAMEL